MPKPAPKSRRRNYWLMKSEPDVFSIDDLERDGTTTWEGVRNYQARNLLRDDIHEGDGVLFYHSNAKPMCVAGIARVSRSGYPDHFAWDPKSRYYDEKSDPEDPTWFMVDIEFVAKFDEPVTRQAMQAEAALAEMMVLQRGSRLSVQPVRAAEWKKVAAMGGIKNA